MNERLQILKMLQEGKITVDEASALIEALDETERAEAEGQARSESASAQAGQTAQTGRPSDSASAGGSGWRDAAEDFGESVAAEVRQATRRAGREARRAAETARRELRRTLREVDIGSEVDEAIREGLEGAMTGVRAGLEGARVGIRAGLEGLRHAFDGGWWEDGSFWDGFAKVDGHFHRARQTATDNLEIEVAGQTVLTVTDATGDIEVVAGTDSHVRIEAVKRAYAADRDSAQRRLDDLTVTADAQGDKIVVKVEDQTVAGRGPAGGGRASVDLQIVAPPNVELIIESTHGDITVGGAFRGLTVTTTNGDVEAKRVEETIKIKAVSGDIEVETGALRRAELSSLHGDIVAAFAPQAGGLYELKTSHGDVDVKLPASAPCSIDAETSAGDLTCSLPGAVQTKTRHSLKATVAGGGPTVTARTASGDVTIRSNA